MTTCPKCHWISISNQNYCYKDGSRMAAAKSCTCGFALSPADKFCTKCGTAVAA